MGKDIKDEARVESLLGVITDLRHSLAPLAFDKEWKTKVGDLIAKGEPKLAEMAKLYGEKDFALGYLTLADFVIAEFSYYVEHVTPENFAKFEFLKRVRNAVESLPEIKKYYESANAMKGPFLPPIAAIQF